jgi:hypothetical protein
MICSIGAKTSVRWFAPAVLAIGLMCCQSAQAGPADSRGFQAERTLRQDRLGAAKSVAKPKRAFLPQNARVLRRDRPWFEVGPAGFWRYVLRWDPGLVLGVGF